MEEKGTQASGTVLVALAAVLADIVALSRTNRRAA